MFLPWAGADQQLADMAKLADAPDLGSGGAIHVGSTPIIRTTLGKRFKGLRFKSVSHLNNNL